jgi:hypothetical protein
MQLRVSFAAPSLSRCRKLRCPKPRVAALRLGPRISLRASAHPPPFSSQTAQSRISVPRFASLRPESSHPIPANQVRNLPQYFPRNFLFLVSCHSPLWTHKRLIGWRAPSGCCGTSRLSPCSPPLESSQISSPNPWCSTSAPKHKRRGAAVSPCPAHVTRKPRPKLRTDNAGHRTQVASLIAEDASSVASPCLSGN